MNNNTLPQKLITNSNFTIEFIDLYSSKSKKTKFEIQKNTVVNLEKVYSFDELEKSNEYKINLIKHPLVFNSFKFTLNGVVYAFFPTHPSLYPEKLKLIFENIKDTKYIYKTDIYTLLYLDDVLNCGGFVEIVTNEEHLEFVKNLESFMEKQDIRIFKQLDTNIDYQRIASKLSNKK